MKFKIITILATVAFVSGVYLSESLGPAYAEVKQINEEAGKVRAETETLPVEDQEAKEKEKVRLPGQTPAVSPETFRMIEIIENKNREIKKKEEELRLKEVRLEALEDKILKDLKKIEKSISESKEQMGAQDAKTKANVNSLTFFCLNISRSFNISIVRRLRIASTTSSLLASSFVLISEIISSCFST